MLKFQQGNAKLGEQIATFSLPSGFTCPFAQLCLSKADPETGKVTDGPQTTFRCFSTSQEAIYPSVREARWHNFLALRNLEMPAMVDLILASLPPDATIVRVHVAGDFFSQAYFDAWMNCAVARPGVIFYGYTKSLPYWIRRMGTLPANFRLTASCGGRHDRLIEEYGLVYARVVYSEAEAAELGLEIDHDDSHAIQAQQPFALLLHGAQPKGSAAARAIVALRKQGEYGYGRRADAQRKTPDQ